MNGSLQLLNSDGYKALHELADEDPDLFLQPDTHLLLQRLEDHSLLSPWADASLPMAPLALEALNSITVDGPSTDRENAPILRQALQQVPDHWFHDERLWATLNCFHLAAYTARRWKFTPRKTTSKARRTRNRKQKKTDFVRLHWLNAGSQARESNAAARLWWLYELAERASAHAVLYDLPALLETLADNVALYHQMLRRPNLVSNPRLAAALIELARDEIPELQTQKHINQTLIQLNTQAGAALFDVNDTGGMKDWVRSVSPPKVRRGPSPRSHIAPALRILSLGGGVQSTVMCLMAAKGLFRHPDTQEVCQPDYALFADTDWEPEGVYETVDWLRTQVPFPIFTVSNGRSLREDVSNGVNSRGRPWLNIPVHLMNQDGTPGGRNWRQCTSDYKIAPIQRKVREILGLPYRRPVPAETKVEMWLGITTDEVQRMKASAELWIEHRYPLVEFTPMDREACLEWFKEHYPNRPLHRSACVGCPFRSASSWLQVSSSDPEGFAEAVEIDRKLRDPEHGITGMFRGTVFLHSRRLPLDEAVRLDVAEEQDLGLLEDCDGHCGV